MDFLTLKKPLAALLVVSMVTAILATSLMAINAYGQYQPGQQNGQQYGQNPSGDGSMTLPGINIPGIVQGSNNLALSISIASQDQNKIYFLVNALAIIDQSSQTASVYQFSTALPGVMDTQTKDIQIDFSKLSSVMGSPQQASMDDLYHILRPSVNSIMVNVVATTTESSSGQQTFQLQDLSMTLPDGTQNAFNLQQPISAVYDTSSMRMYSVGFPELFNVVNTYITNEQNNYYTTIVYNIVPASPIYVTPTILYPAIVPIAFPAVWPIYYPVPVPVPFPTTKPTFTPKPSKMPTVSPTMKPTVSPTMKPTVSPTMKPTVSPTMKPTVSPTMKPTVSPTMKPTISPTIKPSITPTKKPTIFPTVKPTVSAKPTGFNPSLKPKVTAIPSVKPTFKPTLGGGVPSVYKPTFKPTLGGGGGVPTAYKPIVKPTISGGGYVPTAYKPVYKPTLSGGGKVPTAYKPLLGLDYADPAIGDE